MSPLEQVGTTIGYYPCLCVMIRRIFSNLVAINDRFWFSLGFFYVVHVFEGLE